MDIVIPNEETSWSPNHDDGRAAPPQLIVIHATRGKAPSLTLEYLGTVKFCSGPNTNKNSCPHYIVGPSRCCRLVHDDDRAWHAGYLNPRSLGVEVAQPASQPPFSDFEYDCTAQIAADWCRVYRIPAIRVMDENLHGIIGHQDTAQGHAQGKSDPGSQWNWPRFIVLVNAALAAGPATPPVDPWLGVGDGLKALGIAHPEWGTPNRKAKAWHYYDADGDEVLKLTSGDWLVWRKWTGQTAHLLWDKPPAK